MKVAVLLESDFYEPELFYYERRFEEENIELDFVTRLWGEFRACRSEGMNMDLNDVAASHSKT